MDHEINQSDTWVTYDATRDQTTYLSSQEQIVDSGTGQPLTEVTLTTPTQTIHTAAGYDAYGTVRVNEYRQDPGLDPYETPVDDIHRVQVVGDQVTGYTRDGDVIVAADPESSGAPLAGVLHEHRVRGSRLPDRRDRLGGQVRHAGGRNAGDHRPLEPDDGPLGQDRRDRSGQLADLPERVAELSDPQRRLPRGRNQERPYAQGTTESS